MQLNAVIGLPAGSNTVETLRSFAANVGQANTATLLIALISLGACRFMPPGLRRIVPVHLSVLVAGATLVAIFGIDVPTLNAPRSLLPTFAIPPLAELPWERMWLSAVVLALISSLDSLLTSLSADNATQTFHDPNRELVGQGLGNVCAALFGVLPGAGSTFRTMANIRGGGQTPLSALVHSAVIAILILTIGRLIDYIPTSLLAGILIYIGLGIIDWRYIRRFLAMPKTGVAIMVTTWLVALLVNVVSGAAVGIVIASLAFVKRMADLQMEELDIDDAGEPAQGLSEAEKDALAASKGRTILIRLGGPLAFGAANGLAKRLANLSGYRVIVLDFTNVPDIDESGIIALENIVRLGQLHNQDVLIAGLRHAVARPILRFGLADMLRSCQRFRSRIDALRAAAKIVARAARTENRESREQ
jgi:SulP family sulfate permease